MITIADRDVRDLARRYKVEPEVLCTTCGRPAYVAKHFGHTVTRIWMNLAPAPAIPPKRPTMPPKSRLEPIEWITVSEMARVLGVSKMTVYRQVHAGAIPAHRIGRGFRIKRAAFEAYLRGTELVMEADQ